MATSLRRSRTKCDKGNLIREDATAEQVEIYRASTAGLLEALLSADAYFKDKPDLVRCIVARYTDLSDSELIQHENGTRKEAGQDFAQWGRECREENP